MKILRARFHNFRILGDLEIEFSTEPDRNLTVIRAENASGKTTILTALQWGLFGHDALPGRGPREFRLHPIGWVGSDGDSIDISVEVDCEFVSTRNSPTQGLIQTSQVFRIIRSTIESLRNGTLIRTPAKLTVFQMGDAGAKQIDHPEARINEELPRELREVFFTDGDRALHFIEADPKDKRKRVEEAIRSLLGLDVIENALTHIQGRSSELNRAAQGVGVGNELETVASELGEVRDKIAELTSSISDAKTQQGQFQSRIDEIWGQIETALVKGDKRALQERYQSVLADLRSVNNERRQQAREHSHLFRSLTLSYALLAPVLRESMSKLEAMRGEGRFPKTAVPVLEERLKALQCICGESLALDDPDSQARRNHILHLIEETRGADRVQGILSELYSAWNFQMGQAGDDLTWVRSCKQIAEIRDSLEKQREGRGVESKSLEVQISQLPDTDVQGLIQMKDYHEEQLARLRGEQTRGESDLAAQEDREKELAKRREELLGAQDRGNLILAELNVVGDLERVLKNSHDRMTHQELQQVSDRMNSLFMEMIGSDPEENATIHRAAVNQDFDILVYAPNGRSIDPDRDLSGAQRRALTLAFVLALAQVSRVVAPNVIDTPLGMMSGYVKRSVLRTAIRESSQLVLLLTRSEISDCEEILDEKAGKVITLTNPGHFPEILMNDPMVEGTILRCNCDHHSECPLCERRIDPIETLASGG